jgi:hypothetical protein
LQRFNDLFKVHASRRAINVPVATVPRFGFVEDQPASAKRADGHKIMLGLSPLEFDATAPQ